MRRKVLIVSLSVAALAAVPGSARAQTATDVDNGRYSLSQTGDQFIRLDSRTGAMSNCSNSAAGWACYTLPDERSTLDGEIGRLEAENARLKSELTRREATGTVPPFARPFAVPAGSSAKIEPAAPAKMNSEIASKAPAERAATPAPNAEVTDKAELPLPGAEAVHKDGFFSRAWQSLIDLARSLSRG